LLLRIYRMCDTVSSNLVGTEYAIGRKSGNNVFTNAVVGPDTDIVVVITVFEEVVVIIATGKCVFIIELPVNGQVIQILPERIIIRPEYIEAFVFTVEVERWV